MTTVRRNLLFRPFLSRKSNYVVKTGVPCSFSNSYIVLFLCNDRTKSTKLQYNALYHCKKCLKSI